MGSKLQHLLSPTPPDTLYHYTSGAGIKGIVGSLSLQATMLHYLNDAREFKHGLSVAQSALRHRGQRDSNVTHQELLSSLADALDRIEHLQICVFCLSEEEDLLSQWRSYCPPEGGYALGFHIPTLIDRLADNQGLRLLKCTYDPILQRAAVDELLNEILPGHFSALGSGVPCKEVVEAALAMFISKFSLVAATFKHPSFSEEREWRIVSSPLATTDHRLHFRAGKGMLIPYLEITLSGEPAAFGPITIGPNPHQYIAGNSLLAFLTNVGITNWQGLRNSQIPYRPM